MLLDDVALYIQTNGLGTATTSAGGTVNVFRGRMNDTPNVAIGLFEYGGLDHIHTMSTGPGREVFERPRLQITVRGAPFDYDGPRARMNAITDIFDGLANTTLTSTSAWYGIFDAIQGPFVLQRDPNERVTFAVNYQLMKSPST